MKLVVVRKFIFDISEMASGTLAKCQGFLWPVQFASLFEIQMLLHVIKLLLAYSNPNRFSEVQGVVSYC